MFVGRGAELSSLAAAFQRVVSGSPQFVLIEGAAGIGKTMLVEEFLRAKVAASTLRRGRADEIEKDRPFALLSQLLAGQGSPAAGLAIGAPSGAVAASASSEPEPLAAGAELLEMLGRLQQSGRPVTLVLEDLHLADTPSSVAMAFAFRRLLADKVLVVMTARPGELIGSWARLLGAPNAQRILLSGLGLEDLRSLATAAGERLSEPELKRLEEVTDGHPLYALNVLSAGRYQRDQALGWVSPPVPPPSLAALVVSQFEACSKPTQNFIAAACVLGRHFGVVEAAELAGQTDVAAAVEEAVTAAILAEPDRPVLRLRFSHALVHAACYQSLRAARLAELHRKAATITSGTRRIQHRLAAASGPDAALASDLEALAASEYHAGALIAAGEHFRQSAEVSPPGPLADRRLLQAVDAWLVAGEATRALALEEQVRGSGEGVYMDYVRAYLALVSGRLPEAEAGFRRAWQAARAGNEINAPPDLAGRVAVCMAIIVVLTLNTDEMLMWSEQARASAAGDQSSASFAWFCMALALGTLGRGTEALKLLKSESVPITADVLTARGLMEMWCDDLAAAREHLSMAFARSRGGETVRVTQGLGLLAECEYRCGLLGESSVHAELAVDAATEAGRVWDLPLLHSLAAYPAATSGNFELAQAHVQEAANWADILPIPAFRAYAGAAAATMALARDDMGALLDAARSFDSAYRVAELGTASFGPVLAEALVRHARLDEADEVLAEFEARAVASGRRSALLGASRVRGQLEAARGDNVAAAKAFIAGARLVKRLDLPLETARWSEAYGRYLLAMGRAQDGYTRLRDACHVLEAMGAAPYAARVRAVLSAVDAAEPLAASVPAADERREFRLSATETMVAHLVAAGRSNKQIAAELVVSVKTVEYHISNIYRRLGVSSRVKLAQLVRAPA
ncbi:MAG TPA: AAA family ATPase [Acidimicrobiales bacterium]|nr:AAA family ATPase [Acidimicrobiales bacterium]